MDEGSVQTMREELQLAGITQKLSDSTIGEFLEYLQSPQKSTLAPSLDEEITEESVYSRHTIQEVMPKLIKRVYDLAPSPVPPRERDYLLKKVEHQGVMESNIFLTPAPVIPADEEAALQRLPIWRVATAIENDQRMLAMQKRRGAANPGKIYYKHQAQWDRDSFVRRLDAKDKFDWRYEGVGERSSVHGLPKTPTRASRVHPSKLLPTYVPPEANRRDALTHLTRERWKSILTSETIS